MLDVYYILLTSKTLKVKVFYLKIKFVFVFLSFFISFWIVYGCQDSNFSLNNLGISIFPLPLPENVRKIETLQKADTSN